MPQFDEPTVPLSALVSAAIEARQHAYAPYSGYQVGAAITDETGRIFTGVNVENVSFGATICAERAAVAKMVSEGSRSVQSVVVATRDGGTPCGICLQTLLEFAIDPYKVEVHTINGNEELTKFLLSDLIPLGFKSFIVRRTE